MIIYFADRHSNILGQASTHLPEGVRITDDLKTADVDTGVSIFECDIHFDRKTRAKVEEWAEVGNYILRSADDEAEFYNIIDAKIDTKKQTAYIYAEDDGLDLLNDVAEAYEADQYYPINTYIERFASGAGFEIGINEVEGLTRKLSWNSEQTASARLLSIAEAFNNCEISFSFEINGLHISKKYINIYEKRGKDTGIQLRLNKEIDSIVTTKSIANLATALKPKGGTPDNAENPITLLGYEYDDGDFYVEGAVLKSRKALERWSRYLWKDDDSRQLGGHIVKSFSYDTTSQAALCEKTIEELKKVCDMEINYEADITKFPENVKVGDRVNIVDDAGSLYLSSRVLILETSETEKTRRAVLGEHLIRKSGISAKVEQLAAEFAKVTVSVARAKAISDNANRLAAQAQTQATSALASAEAAQAVADEAKSASDAAAQAAANAQSQAQAAEAAVDKVEESVASIEKTVIEAKNAADNAHQAAITATTKADEAKTAADNAQTAAENAGTAAENAQTAANDASNIANTAKSTAETAKDTAERATATAEAAKLDGEQAKKDIDAFEESLETVKNTMTADYARKTDLTETTANLQTQITKNAADLKSTANKVQIIDETENNAADLVETAEKIADLAQNQANLAAEEAKAAQLAADEAQKEAETAQAEADTAKAAYEEAKRVSDAAEATLLVAKKDLATVNSRADATEKEIEAAQSAVTNAQATVDAAILEADEARKQADNAQNVANKAVSNAEKAQATANDAAYSAELAQATADEAKGKADEAKKVAAEALAAAEQAQSTANEAITAADNAQATADVAALEAENAQKTADEANLLLQQANDKLEQAQARLEEVRADAETTTEDIAAAEADVATAQQGVNDAESEANNAQAAADTAKEKATTAQAAADTAKADADEAQAAAREAKFAADKARGAVNALAKHLTEAETSITQNSEQIELRATKTEVTETLGGYYTKEETDAQISVESDGITSSVMETVRELQAADKATAERLTASESLIKQLSDSISMIVTDQKQYFKAEYNAETGEYKATDEEITEMIKEEETEVVTTTGEKVFSYTAADGTTAYCIITCKSSLMEQTSSGWTFSTSAIQSAIKGVSDELDKVEKSLGETDAVVSVLNEALKGEKGLINYVNIGSYNGKPSIELGQQLAEDDPETEIHKLIITNEKILFKVGTKEPTEIVSDGISTENITIEEELRQTHKDVAGAFVWAMRANGNYGLSWKEGES